MRFSPNDCESPMLQFFMKVIYYIALVALVYALILPRTIYFYRKPLFRPILGGLNRYDVVLSVGETYHLYVFGINKRVSFQTTDMKVATVNLLGTVRAWRPGNTIVKVSYDHKVLRCRVRVIALNKKSMTLHVGEHKRVYVKNVFIGARYHSSDASIATVNRYGVVNAKQKGSATITVTYKGKSLPCKIVVR